MEVTKKDVEKLIEIKKADSFLNHLWNFISRDYRAQGEISRSFIKVWKQSFWNGGFYPVFRFEFNANNHLINITGKLNPIAKLLIGLISCGFIIGIFPKNPTEFDYLSYWLPISVVIIFLFILIFIFRKLYLFEKRNQLDDIFEQLDIEIEEKKPEKEWSAKNILIRLFTYPFCLFLIGINVFLIIPNGQYILALGSLAMVSFYLIVDLKMIFREKTTGNNV
ncbi:hypothetical protein [Aequorivita antarctica]|uniref:Uncharacterized protein n=1 Tax=Aequorivita antarctica TaxID=153266 RepID=A0A5C6Z2N1_9FLAO|nr:hypothetical protein [Aequorivita antarctica]TXD74391.1 hypothetical protein ESU54_03855 [Aequorivita antarctica]SRX73747.1 hypothetical protein AEQU3_01182 [Aequorivita antarctica]